MTFPYRLWENCLMTLGIHLKHDFKYNGWREKVKVSFSCYLWYYCFLSKHLTVIWSHVSQIFGCWMVWLLEKSYWSSRWPKCAESVGMFLLFSYTSLTLDGFHFEISSWYLIPLTSSPSLSMLLLGRNVSNASGYFILSILRRKITWMGSTSKWTISYMDKA